MKPAAASLARYRQLLRQTRELYRSSAHRIVREHPELAPAKGDFVQLMDDLHGGLVLRIYLTVCEADHQWTAGERDLAIELAEHMWGSRLEGSDLNRAMRHAAEKSKGLEWGTLVGPFARLAPLRDEVTDLETLVIRQSNLVARVDGVFSASERHAIKTIVDKLKKYFGTAPAATKPPPQPVEWPAKPVLDVEARRTDESSQEATPGADAPRPLEEVLADLDALVGLDAVKQELRSLSNYLTMQRRRGEAGLPATEISLHLVFAGNPGTGKTTVARFFGEAMRAMGVLPTGQLIETDRSGLVAEYAGQTGPKTNQKIDEALGGVLFIDEAYGLVGSQGDDPFGREALQTLLKRAEDNRHELSVILAGYPDEMSQLLGANPGLSSRFSRTIRFDDYGPLELCLIFGRLMDQHHYRLTPEGRLRVIQAITAMHAQRDEQFGNGRAIRNLFEQAILRMANRLAEMPTLSDDELVTLEAADIRLDQPAADGEAPQRVRVVCSACQLEKEAGTEVVGANLKCPQCGERFRADWCELVG